MDGVSYPGDESLGYQSQTRIQEVEPIFGGRSIVYLGLLISKSIWRSYCVGLEFERKELEERPYNRSFQQSVVLFV